MSPNVKPAVISRVLDIIEAVLSLSPSDEEVSSLVLRPHIPKVLKCLATAIERSKDAAASNILGHRQITILSELAPHLTDAKQALILLTPVSLSLKKPSKVVPGAVRVGVVGVIPPVHHSTRSALISAYQKLVEAGPSLSPLSSLVDGLNTYSTRRMDELDFDRRFFAFTQLDGDSSRTFTPAHLTPILCNILYFVQDTEELTLHTNSATVLRIFVDIVSKTSDGEWEGIPI